jgi:hypothetical protein
MNVCARIVLQPIPNHPCHGRNLAEITLEAFGLDRAQWLRFASHLLFVISRSSVRIRRVAPKKPIKSNGYKDDRSDALVILGLCPCCVRIRSDNGDLTCRVAC